MKPKWIAVVLGGLLVTCLVFGQTAAAWAQDRSYDGVTSGEVFVELLVLRPMGAVATLVGGTVFVGTLPFTVWGGSDQVSFVRRKLVDDPAGYAFGRPLGCPVPDYSSERPAYCYEREED